MDDQQINDPIEEPKPTLEQEKIILEKGKLVLEQDKIKREIRELKWWNPVKTIILLLSAIAPTLYLIYYGELRELKKSYEAYVLKEGKAKDSLNNTIIKRDFIINKIDSSFLRINYSLDSTNRILKNNYSTIQKLRNDSVILAIGNIASSGSLKEQNRAYSNLYQEYQKQQSRISDTSRFYQAKINQLNVESKTTIFSLQNAVNITRKDLNYLRAMYERETGKKSPF